MSKVLVGFEPGLYIPLAIAMRSNHRTKETSYSMPWYTTCVEWEALFESAIDRCLTLISNI